MKKAKLLVQSFVNSVFNTYIVVNTQVSIKVDIEKSKAVFSLTHLIDTGLGQIEVLRLVSVP